MIMKGQDVNLDALTIYQRGYQDSGSIFQKHVDSKTFFHELRAAITTELETQGFCTLLDDFLEQLTCQRNSIDVIFYSVLVDIYHEYRGEGKAGAEGSVVPHVIQSSDPGDPILWKDCKRFNYRTKTLCDSREIREKVVAIRDLGRKKHLSELRSVMTSHEITEQAQTKAQQTIKEASAQAQQIIEEASVQAQQIIEKASAQEEAILGDAKKSAEEQASRLIEEYIEKAQRDQKQENGRMLEEYMDKTLSDCQTADRLHKEMISSTNTYQAKWIQTVDKMLEQLTAEKTEFYRHLRAWQNALYPSGLNRIAESYLEFYRMVNVDRIIRREIVFPDPDIQPNDNILRGLNQLNTNLNKCLSHMEIALNRMGLKTYYPQSGEPFDEIWHICDEEQVSPLGRQISECILPGVVRRDELLGDDILIKALVRVDR